MGLLTQAAFISEKKKKGDSIMLSPKSQST